MKYLLLITLLIIFPIASCKEKETKVDSKRMASMLWDMQVANTYLASQKEAKGWDSAMYLQNQHSAIERICSLHNISQAEFQKTMHYYKNQPQEMQKLIHIIKDSAENYFNGQPTMELL